MHGCVQGLAFPSGGAAALTVTLVAPRAFCPLGRHEAGWEAEAGETFEQFDFSPTWEASVGTEVNAGPEWPLCAEEEREKKKCQRSKTGDTGEERRKRGTEERGTGDQVIHNSSERHIPKVSS